MSKIVKVVLVIVAVILALGGCVAGTYNGFVSSREEIKSQKSQIGVVLQRRADLIPNLVETVKGYSNHESETLVKVVDARNGLTQAIASNDMEKIANADGKLNVAVNALREAYPDLKANENYIALMDELEGSENRISVERKTYNEKVESYNKSIKSFPSNIFAGMFGFEAEKYFEATEGVEVVPSVNFG